MTIETQTAQWLTVDEGWGRRAVDFAAILEPAACREYVAMHHHLQVGEGDRLLDIACGSGLAMELATLRGAAVAGIDASPRLIAVARDRVPHADVRVGEMAALPWEDDTFDVVTSFRGLSATTEEALAEARRVLRPGGRISVTTWGHIKVSPGAWALSPLLLSAHDKVRSQAQMVTLGPPDVGESVLAEAGFVDVRRHRVPFAWEFCDPEAFARALASTGPGYEAIQHVGEDEFHRNCVDVATQRVRDGLPLRADLDCVGFTAKVPAAAVEGSFLGVPAETDEVRLLAEEDLSDLGFVMNATKLWMHDPAAMAALFELIVPTAREAGLSIPERAVATIVGTALAGDTYCPLAWGDKLAKATTPEIAASVMLGSDDLLDDRERAVVAWTRIVVAAPKSATPADIARLRAVGFEHAQILRLTLFIALRIAFSTVNGALGARPEAEYVEHVDPAVRAAWSTMFG
jgi:SAM-dependent methyltransferase/alkylhydroperoxidase family enzyme